MSQPPDDPPLLEARGIRKRFLGVQALHEVDLTLRRGEVVAVIGENGAGKSTLMKILAGVQSPEEGEIRFLGNRVQIGSVETGLALGIALIHQELNLSDNLDVASNIFLGREPGRWGWIDRRRLDAEATKVLARVGLDVEPRTIAGRLSIGQQQLVEIAKALSTGARLLIMDEPTSSLSQRETETLFQVIDELRRDGVSVLYISHRLGEVQAVADRVVVLRDGRNAGELGRDEIGHDRMVRLMVGREIAQFYNRQPHAAGERVLEVRQLVTAAHPQRQISFSIHAGEIVGIAGLVGAGRTELLETLFGVAAPLAGQVLVAGRAVKFRSPSDALRAGLALVPEDRKQQGLILEMSLGENVSLAGLRPDRRPRVWIDREAEQALAAEMVGRLNIQTPSIRQRVEFLSGGNQQKVVLSKWLALKPRILLLDEPTRGVDIGAKEEIYHLIDRLAASGVAILFASSEMEETLGIADRALVMHEGRISGELSRQSLSEQRVMQLATGLAPLADSPADASAPGTAAR